MELLSSRIRSALTELHRSIEATPIAIAMMSDFIHPFDYCNLLTQLFHIHRSVETGFMANDRIGKFFTKEMLRTETIQRDLAIWGKSTEDFPLNSYSARIGSRIHYWSQNRPECLIGSLYVLEGSRMGSLIIGRTLGRALGIPAGIDSGIEYHLEGAETTPRRFKTLKEEIDKENWSQEETLSIIEGARDFMSLFLALYGSLPARTKSETTTIPFPVNLIRARNESIAS